MNCCEIDVSGLLPPEPMTHIIKHLASLPAETVLIVHHRREPFPLYERLIANQWLYHTKKRGENFIIYIARREETELFSHFLHSKSL